MDFDRLHLHSAIHGCGTLGRGPGQSDWAGGAGVEGEKAQRPGVRLQTPVLRRRPSPPGFVG